ncbi:hypothetical protein GCM10026988_20170 [Vibrio panuliri]
MINMTKNTHPKDQKIIRLLQQNGLIKNEARQRLKQEVYSLDRNEIQKIQRYSKHFGLNAKQKMINEILDIRRDTMLGKLSASF